jgi:hypothetical protein
LVDAEGKDGPYVRAGLAPHSSSLYVAIKAVSLAAGRRGMDLASRGADVAVEIWLDTGNPPGVRTQ